MKTKTDSKVKNRIPLVPESVIEDEFAKSEKLAQSVTGFESDVALAELCMIFGGVKLKDNLHAEAYVYFFKAARIAEKSKRHRHVLRLALAKMCECLYIQGNYNRAIPIGQRALNLYPDVVEESERRLFVGLCEWLGYMLLKSRRFAQALPVYRRLSQAISNDMNQLFEAAARSRAYISVMVPQGDSRFREVDLAFVEILKMKLALVPHMMASADANLSYTINDDTVKDPYLWMEDVSSPEVTSWVDSESVYAQTYFDGMEHRPSMTRQYRRNFPTGSCSMPWRYGDRFIYRYVKPGTYDTIWCSAKRFMVMPKVILDEAALGGGKHVTDSFVSPDGRWLAYGISIGGSDWTTWYVRDTKSLTDLSDTISGIGNNYIGWASDSSGFYYSRREFRENESLREGVYFHKLKRSQRKDVLVIPTGKNDSASVVCVNQDIFVYRWVNNSCTVSLKLENSETLLLESGRSSPRCISVDKEFFWFVAHFKGARQLIRIARRTGHKKVVIQSDKFPMQSAFRVHDGWVAKFLVDGCSELRLYSREGKFERRLKVSDYCSIDETACVGPNEFLFGAEGFSFPSSLRLLNVSTGKETLAFQSQVALASENLTTTKHIVRSKDGTRLVVYLTHKKALRLTKDTPMLLTAYGGFAISMKPNYDPCDATWMEMGGVAATAIIRGGGEYGRAWHESATGVNRQRAYDDFIACAEYLIRKNFTSPKRLAISGSSNGGLLMAAVMTQRPELFGAVNICAPLTDMLRYDKLARGRNWVGEYGSPSDPKYYAALKAYSPYHNIRKGVKYPPVLIQVWQNDDRVCPSHAYKFTARLREAASSKNKNPILMMVYKNAGHNGASDGCTQPEDMLAFFAQVFKIKQV